VNQFFLNDSAVLQLPCRFAPELVFVIEERLTTVRE
jgi:hypothetical protein